MRSFCYQWICDTPAKLICHQICSKLQSLCLTKTPLLIRLQHLALALVQFGIIPVNLATRLTWNLKTSEEILVVTPTKINLEQNLQKKCPLTRNKNIIPATRIKLLPEEQISCHRNTFQVTRTFLMSQRCDSCWGDAFIIIRIQFLPQ